MTVMSCAPAKHQNGMAEASTPITKQLRASLTGALKFHQELVDSALLSVDAAAQLNQPLTLTYLECMKVRMEAHANASSAPELVGCEPEGGIACSPEAHAPPKRRRPLVPSAKSSSKKSKSATGRVSNTLRTMEDLRGAIAADVDSSTTPLWHAVSVDEDGGFLQTAVPQQVSVEFGNIIPAEQRCHGREDDSEVVVWQIDDDGFIKCMV
jgi:hypothetical protein